MPILLALLLSLSQAGPAPRKDPSIFNGKDLSGWSAGEMKYWSVRDGAIVGHSDAPVPRNEFLWFKGEVRDFYLALDVRLEPDDRNAGIQFRSVKADAHGQALGYQADVGAGVWGKLYHEHGRGKLDWNDRGPGAVKRGDWNRYEILAVGPRIWTAINGRICVAYEEPKGERRGRIALQIHSGPPLTVRYRIRELIHDPRTELAGRNEAQLVRLIKGADPGPVSPYLRPLRPARPPAKAFDGGFSIDSDQTVVVLGGTNALETARHGYLESLIAAAHPKHRIRWRTLAWQADSVYLQQRPRHFYLPGPLPSYKGEPDAREPVTADTILLWMGQSESLDGPSRLGAFEAAYRKLVGDLRKLTPRIVLVTPVPFGDPLHLGIDVESRNRSLADYAAVIRKIAAQGGLPAVDLFSALRGGESDATRDGLHLSARGHWRAAQAFGRQLGLEARLKSITLKGDGTLAPAAAESLRRCVLERGRLWYAYWRPTNWSFLYGNRQHVPSSRDHVDSSKRWFPVEVLSIESDLERADGAVFQAAREAGGHD